MVSVCVSCINRKRKFKPFHYFATREFLNNQLDFYLESTLHEYCLQYFDDFFYRKVNYCSYRNFKNPVIHLYFFDSETGEDLGSYYFEVKGVK